MSLDWSPSRHAVAAALLTVAAVSMSCSGDSPTSIEEPPAPLVLSLSAPAGGEATVINGIGACSIPFSATLRGGVPNATVQFDSATLTYTALKTGAVSTETVTAGEVATWFGSSTVPTGATASGTRNVSRSRAFSVRHDIRYRAAGEVRSVTHDFACRFASVDTVVLSATSLAMRTADTTRLSASVRDSVGRPLSGRLVAWQSSDTLIARVDSAGLVLARRGGAARIIAESEGRLDTVLINVTATVAAVTVEPTSLRVELGQAVTLVATPRDAEGNALSGRAVTWRSENDSTVTVLSNGALQLRRTGTTNVIASSEGISTAVPITVIPRAAYIRITADSVLALPKDSIALTAEVRTQTQQILTDRLIAWSSLDTSIVTVDSTGRVHVRWPGVGRIVARHNAFADTVRIVVRVPAASIAIAESNVAIGVGRTLTFTAIVRDTAGGMIANRPALWSSSDTLRARVSAGGTVTGVAEGSATISANVEGKIATRNLLVVKAVRSFQAFLNVERLIAGDTTTLRVEARDMNLQPIANPWVVWSSSNPEIATVDSTGFIRTIAPGKTYIRAIGADFQWSGEFTVLPAVAIVTATPSPATVQVGDYILLEARTQAADSSYLQSRPVTWTTLNPTIASVSDGRVTGVGQGTGRIVATAEGKSDTVVVTVTARRAVATITWVPSSISMIAGEVRSLIPVMRDANGAIVQGRTATVTTSNGSLLSAVYNVISGEVGIRAFTTLGTGTVRITSGSVFAVLNVSVIPPVRTVEIVAEGSTSLPAGDTVVVRARMRAEDGSIVTGREVSWGTTNDRVIQVTPRPDFQTAVVRGVGEGIASVQANVMQEGILASTDIQVLPGVANIDIAPLAARVATGGQITLRATPRDGLNGVLGDRLVTWTSSAPSIATVSQTGVVTGVAVGTAMITAASGGTYSQATISVTRPIATITLAPAIDTVEKGDSISLTPTIRDATGAILSGTVLSWSSSNPVRASVNQQGRIVGLLSGTVTITASAEGRSGTAQVFVQQSSADIRIIPATRTVAVDSIFDAIAIVTDATGEPLPDRPITWTSANPAVATVSATGAVRAVAPGRTAIAATSEGRSASLDLTVTEQVGTVRVTLPKDTLRVGESGQATTAAFGALSGLPVDAPVSVWASVDPAIASVSNTGVVTARSPGFTDIHAYAGGIFGQIRVVVQPPALASVSVTPATLTLPMGTEQALSATLRDESGNLLIAGGELQVSWASSNNVAVRVSSTGRVSTTGTPGTATITATASGISASATVTVPPVGVTATVAFELARDTILVGQRQIFPARATDANGVQVSDPITYTSGATGIATVDANGYVTGVAPGIATITATAGGRSANLFIQVLPAGQPGILRLSPASFSLLQGQTRELTIQLTDVSENVVSISSRSWTSSNPAIATVATNGVVTAVANGTATITAVASGPGVSNTSATSTIVVGRVPVSSVAVSPENATLLPNQTLQLQAVPMDANGNVLARACTWISQYPQIATVSSSGLVTARTLGDLFVTVICDGAVAATGVRVVSTLTPVSRVVVTPGRVEANTPGIGEARQMRADVYDATGTLVSGRTIIWSSTNTAIVQVTGGGLATPVANGAAAIIASVDGKADTAWFSVGFRHLRGIDITYPLIIPLGSKVLPVLRLTDQLGEPMSATGRALVWQSTNANSAPVASNGEVTGRAEGAATILVSVEGLEARAGVNVLSTTDPVVNVEVGPADRQIIVGDSAGYNAVVTRASGRLEFLSATAPAWSSSAPGIASVGGTMLNPIYQGDERVVRGEAPGLATITATYEGVSGSARIAVVSPVPVASVSVAPNPLTVTVREYGYLAATVRDAANNTLLNRRVIWRSNNTSIATVDSLSGFVFGVALGTATVTAWVEGISAATTVNVVPSQPAVASLAVSPATSMISVGSSTQLTATLRSSTGAVLTGRLVTWQSSNPAVAAVSSSGRVTGAATGSVTITARSEGISGTASVTVTSGGSGGGGGGGGGYCSTQIAVGTIGPGGDTGWRTTIFDGLDYRVTMGTFNSGSASNPSYIRNLWLRNRYTQKLWYSVAGPLQTQPTGGSFNGSIDAGANQSVNYNYGPPNVPVYVFIGGLRLGSSTATPYCEP